MARCEENNLLGKFTLSGIPCSPVGTAKIFVSYIIDETGILTVSAKEKTTGRRNEIRVTTDKGRHSKEEIERMIKDAENYADEYKKRVQAKNYLHNLVNKLEDAMLMDENIQAKMAHADKVKIHYAVRQTMQWLQTNQALVDYKFYEKCFEHVVVLNDALPILYRAQTATRALR